MHRFGTVAWEKNDLPIVVIFYILDVAVNLISISNILLNSQLFESQLRSLSVLITQFSNHKIILHN